MSIGIDTPAFLPRPRRIGRPSGQRSKTSARLPARKTAVFRPLPFLKRRPLPGGGNGSLSRSTCPPANTTPPPAPSSMPGSESTRGQPKPLPCSDASATPPTRKAAAFPAPASPPGAQPSSGQRQGSLLRSTYPLQTQRPCEPNGPQGHSRTLPRPGLNRPLGNPNRFHVPMLLQDTRRGGRQLFAPAAQEPFGPPAPASSSPSCPPAPGPGPAGA